MRTRVASRYHRHLANLVMLAAGVLLMVSCAVLPPGEPLTGTAPLQNQRAEKELARLAEMEEIDTLIRLDNQWLGNRFETALQSRADRGKTYNIQNIRAIFNNQIIRLEAIVDVYDEEGNKLTAALWGDVLLQYRDKGLEWRPRFNDLQIRSKEFVFAGNSYVEADAELTQLLLQNLNQDIAQAVIESDGNTISVNPVPLGEIQVGASLPGFAESNTRNTQSLRGVFRIAGSAVLIGPSVTSIALDMAFIADLSTCPADISVSRAVFARDIQSREPVGIARSVGNTTDVGYFYSEIAGAKHPLTIIHYWFADGLPIAVKELPVGASERWRTWSSKGAASSDASQWEVLVVEKESGCILASKSVRTLEPEIPASRVTQEQAGQTFNRLNHEFSKRTSMFSIIRDKPGIALIESRRSFLQEVLQAALEDLSIDAEFDPATLSALQFSAELQSFDPTAIRCEHRDCSPAPVCMASLGQCKRLRDSRNCSSCQFRNPLNNRCISEAIDPLCEAARKRQNERYEEEHNACITQAEHEKRECDRLNAQAMNSCQIESGFEESACDSVKTRLDAIQPDAPLAIISARAQARGHLVANFSNFMLDNDLHALKMDLSLQSRLQLDGDLDFEPTDIQTPLTKCIAAWRKPFSSRMAGASTLTRLLSRFERGPDMLTANWSGFGTTIKSRPSPLESVFVNNPQLLANCKIGLTVKQVEQAISGNDAPFFQGRTELMIQAMPTKIHLAPATIGYGSMVHSAGASLTTQNLRYDIQ